MSLLLGLLAGSGNPVAVAAQGGAGNRGSAGLSVLRAIAVIGLAASIGTAGLGVKRAEAARGVAGSVGKAGLGVIRDVRAQGVSGAIGKAGLGSTRAIAARGVAGSSALANFGIARAVAARGVAGEVAQAGLSVNRALAVRGVNSSVGQAGLTAQRSLASRNIAGAVGKAGLGVNRDIAAKGMAAGIGKAGLADFGAPLAVAAQGVAGSSASGFFVVVAGTTPPAFSPELGAGSHRGGRGGMELYAAMRAAEADRRAGRKPVATITAPAEGAQSTAVVPSVVLPPRRVVALEPVDLDEHDRELAALRQVDVPAESIDAPVLIDVVEPDEFAGFTQAARDALEARAQSARDREVRAAQIVAQARADALEALRTKVRNIRDKQDGVARSQAKLYALGHKPEPVPSISPVAYATALAQAQRDLSADEELAWVLLIAT